MINTKTISSLAVLVASLSVTVQAAEGRLRSSSSSSSSYRRQLLDNDQECVLYKAEVRYEGENGAPAYDEDFWACEFPEEQFHNTMDNMIKLDGISVDDIESSGAVSGESILRASNMYVVENLGTQEAKLEVDPEEAVIEPLADTDVRHARNRRLARAAARRRLATSAPGTYEALVVRVVDSNGAKLSTDAATLSSDVFTDAVSLGTHYKACSKDKFNVVPSSDGGGTGVVDVHVDVAASQGSGAIESAATTKSQEEYGDGSWLHLKYDFVLYCLPPGTGGWVAYAYINHYRSYYNNDWCSQVSALMHEVGHNLNLAHSGHSGDEYGDQSGMMGYSYFSDDGPQMCFNAAKSYQLEWYNDQEATIDPSTIVGSKTYTVNGVADYQSNPDAVVTLRLELDSSGDYYLMYNRAVGPNSGTQEAVNQIAIVKKQGSPFSYGTSWLEAQLSSGQSWTVTDWAGSGVDVTVTVDGAIGSSIQDAKIIISSTLVGDTPAPTSAPTNADTILQNTDAPTASPTTAGKPKCVDPKGKFTVTNKKGTKTKKVQCKKAKKKCNWKTEDGQKLFTICPVACQSKINDKNLAKLWCVHE